MHCRPSNLRRRRQRPGHRVPRVLKRQDDERDADVPDAHLGPRERELTWAAEGRRAPETTVRICPRQLLCSAPPRPPPTAVPRPLGLIDLARGRRTVPRRDRILVQHGTVLGELREARVRRADEVDQGREVVRLREVELSAEQHRRDGGFRRLLGRRADIPSSACSVPASTSSRVMRESAAAIWPPAAPGKRTAAVLRTHPPARPA